MYWKDWGVISGFSLTRSSSSSVSGYLKRNSEFEFHNWKLLKRSSYLAKGGSCHFPLVMTTANPDTVTAEVEMVGGSKPQDRRDSTRRI